MAVTSLYSTSLILDTGTGARKKESADIESLH